jgi:hypothetical protein
MQHARLAVVDAFNNSRAVERAGVTRLTAASRIKRRAVENDTAPTTNAIRYVNHTSFKLDKMRVGIIESLGYGHGNIIHRLRGFTLKLV